jgi:hypothetical protein
MHAVIFVSDSLEVTKYTHVYVHFPNISHKLTIFLYIYYSGTCRINILFIIQIMPTTRQTICYIQKQKQRIPGSDVKESS